MANYPYQAKFVEELPANPVAEVCSRLNKNFGSDEELLMGLNDAIQIYANFKGKSDCIDLLKPSTHPAYSYQRCSEFVVPDCSNGKTDMFLPEEWDFEKYSNQCFGSYGVRPRKDAVELQYGGKRVEGVSNIIFSNGLLDPWSGYGVLQSYNKLVDIIIIPEGAHHFDLRGDHELDPSTVREARQFHLQRFKKWIKDYDSEILIRKFNM
jgi:lysosomal Pro-X carboxypeptidase